MWDSAVEHSLRLWGHMPYRDRATVLSWVSDFVDGRVGVAPEITVLEKDFVSGPDSGLVVVSLRTATTVTYVQPVIQRGEPRWIVTFEPRAEPLDLDAVGVAQLSSDLGELAELCAFLQLKTDEARAARRVALSSD